MSYSAAVSARESILGGVKYVPKCANPGTLVVFEPNAYAILTSKNKSSLLFAAAEYGQGRVFAVAHESYLENFTKHPEYFEPLWPNIKRWLANEDVSDESIVSIEQFESVSDIPAGVKILLWVGTVNKTEMFINQLLKKFVSNGGSVLCGMCPWGWLNKSHGKILDEMSLNKFLCLVGICFSPDLCDFEGGNSLKVENNQAYKSHLGHAISTLSSDMNEVRNVEEILTKAIFCLPVNEAAKHLEKLIKVLYKYISVKYKPSFDNPVTCPIGRALLSIASKVYLKFTQCSIRVKAPNIDEFPGSMPVLSLISNQLALNNNNNNNNQFTKIIDIKSKYDEFHCTGCYLAAGGCAQITVVEGNPSGWEVRVGSHTDDLTSMPEIRRWPQLSVSVKLKKSVSLTSAFGGLIYLESPKGSSSIRVKIESVLEAPYFDLNRPETVSVWSTARKAPGLWAELSGKHISFVVPSAAIRNLHSPEEGLKVWDSIVTAGHELRGTNASSTWRERVVIDIQPYGNSIHSGYPVVISYETAFNDQGSLVLFSPKEIYQRGWNIIHELAHNMQRHVWTPKGTEEITVNIFTLHAYEIVLKEIAWKNKFFEERLAKSGIKDFKFTYDDWCSKPYIGLCLYNQLIRSFGWNSFKNIFCEYETISDMEFESESEKWSEWITRFSSIVGLNVAPLFYFWSVPFAESELKMEAHLTDWLPDDQFTQMFPQRVELVKQKYANLIIGDESIYSTCS